MVSTTLIRAQEKFEEFEMRNVLWLSLCVCCLFGKFIDEILKLTLTQKL